MKDSIVKKYLNHKEEIVRIYALEYFAYKNTKDIEVTEFALVNLFKSVEYEETLRILSLFPKLIKDEDILRHVYNIDTKDKIINNHIDNIIASSDTKLLKRIPFVKPKSRQAMKKYKKRLSLSKLKTKKLWDKLWKHSKSAESKFRLKFNYDYGEWIIDELSTRRDFDYNLFLDKLNYNMKNREKCSDIDDMYLCFMAGKLKSKEAISFLIDCVKCDGDCSYEKASEALINIAKKEVIDILEKEYFKEGTHFRTWAVEILEKIKSKESEKLLLKLLDKDKNITKKTAIAYGLCKHFSKSAIPKVLNLLDNGYDRLLVNLEEGMYVNHIVNGLNHRDLIKWKRSISDEKIRVKKAMESMINGDVNTPVTREKIGRNAPCPCGSGKKYKKCCLNK
ncbi:MAG: hypothetical protein FH753_09655 [Firmicutes bacterium]|nr:hypothetical protein [Bacillota bacterium]